MPVYSSFGIGKEKIIVLHSWFSDSAHYVPILPYLDTENFSFLLMDLPGYGKAKDVKKFSLDELTQEIMHVTNTLGWEKFHLISQGMSSLLAQKLIVEYPKKIKSSISISPMLPFPTIQETEILSFLEGAALSDEESATECIHVLTNRRYCDYAAKKLVQNWFNCSTEKARIAYLDMFTKTNFLKKAKGVQIPFLVLYGEHGITPDETSLRTFLEIYPLAECVCCKNAGHFPVQETPLTVATYIDKFLNKNL